MSKISAYASIAATSMDGADYLVGTDDSARRTHRFTLTELTKFFGHKFLVNGTTSAHIQAGLDAANAAGGGIVYVIGTTYTITTALLIYSNTYLYIEQGVTLLRGASIDNMIRNGSLGVTGGFTANQNIVVEGGTWDGNRTNFASNTTVMAFGHMTNIEVKNLTIQNWYDWHAIEFNACKNARAEFCRFSDRFDAGNGGETVQVDGMISSAQFPWFGPYDATFCDDVTVRGCTFGAALKRGVGSHSSASGFRHTRIRIKDNYFSDMSDRAIITLNWQDVEVSGNAFTNCFVGVHFSSDGTACSGFRVVNNTFRSFARDVPNDRGVFVERPPVDYTLTGGVITGNYFTGISRHPVGIDYASDWSVTGNTFRSNGTAAVAGTDVYIFNSTNCTVSGNVSYAPASVSYRVATGSNVSIVGNVSTGAVDDGILLETSIHCTVSGNTVTTVTGATGVGINVLGGSFNTVNGNRVRVTGGSGINVNSADCLINGNSVSEASQGTDNTHSCIRIQDGSGVNADRNHIANNTCRRGTLTNKPKYGVEVTAGSEDTIVSNNDLFDSGSTSQIGNAGTNSVIRNNRGFNPVGVSSITVGASPFTHTAGANPQEVYIFSGTVSSVTRGGTQIANATNVRVHLEPNQSLIVTYSVLPTMVSDVV